MVPAGVHGDEGAGRQVAVTAFPGEEVVEVEEGVGVGGGAVGDPDDGKGCDQVFGGDEVGGRAGGGEVGGCVEVGAGVLVDGEDGFVPAVGLDPGCYVEPHGRNTGEEGEVGGEAVGEIDDAAAEWVTIRRGRYPIGFAWGRGR
jgi:hypothetical protein